jgi:hypothetical protein
VRDTTFKGGGARNIISGLKVPRQCPLVLLVEVCLTESEAFKDCRKEVEPRFYCVCSELIFVLRWKGCIIVKF